MKKFHNLAVLCLLCFTLILSSGCGNQARIETTKNDFIAYSNFVIEGNGANLKGFLESKKGNFKAWQKTAGKGLPEGQVLLGLSHLYGVSVRENPKEAVNWFRKAATQGFAEGQYQLGKAYFLGEGIEQDQPEGVKWLFKAKEQEHTEADALFQITKISPRVRTVPVVYRATEEDGGAESTDRAAEQQSGETTTRSSGGLLGRLFGTRTTEKREDTNTPTPSPATNGIVASSESPFIELERHARFVWSAAFSPDGKKIVTVSADRTDLATRTVQIWDAETGKELKKLEEHTGRVASATFSPDGSKIITTSSNTAHIWDAETGKELRRLGSSVDRIYVDHAIFSPDGKMVLTRASEIAHIWDAETGEKVHRFEHAYADGFVWSAAFSPDGKKFVTTTSGASEGSKNGILHIWDAETGRKLASRKVYVRMNTVVFLPDGKKFVTVANDGVAYIWDAEVVSGAIKPHLQRFAWGDAGKLGDTSKIFYVASSPDATKILTTGRDHGDPTSITRIWDAETGKELRTFKGSSAAFSSDGSKIITGGNDNTARIWNTETGELVQELEGHTDYLSYVTFSPDGKKVVTDSSERTAIWKLDKLTEADLQQIAGTVRERHTVLQEQRNLEARAQSPEEKSRRETIDFILKFCVSATANVPFVEFTSTRSVNFSPDGKRVVVAFDAQRKATVMIWDIETRGLLTTLVGDIPKDSPASFSLDGKQIIVGSPNRFWDAESGKELKESEGHAPPPPSQVGGKITNIRDSVVQVLDAETREELKKLEGHTGTIRVAALSSDGTKIVTTGTDNTTRIWDAETGKELHKLPFRSESFAFSPGDQAIVTGTEEGIIQIWYVETGKELQKIEGFATRVLNVAFSPDGRRVFANTRIATRIWEWDKLSEADLRHISADARERRAGMEAVRAADAQRIAEAEAIAASVHADFVARGGAPPPPPPGSALQQMPPLNLGGQPRTTPQSQAPAPSQPAASYPCGRCNGKGLIDIACALCNGTGLSGPANLRTMCTSCNGKGFPTCIDCRGTGKR